MPINSMMLSSNNASTSISGYYILLNGCTETGFYNHLKYTFQYDESTNELFKYSKLTNAVSLRYIQKTKFDSNDWTDTSLLSTINITLPFIFPMLLNNLTNLGIEMSSNSDGVPYSNINFYNKTYDNNIELFKQLNPDAYDVFYNTTINDVDKSKVDLINYNMQYCTVTSDILHDYLKAQSNWMNFSNLTKTKTIFWFPPDMSITFSGTPSITASNPISANIINIMKGSRYCHTFKPTVIDYTNKHVTLFSYVKSNMTNPNLFLLRKESNNTAINSIKGAINLEMALKEIAVYPEDISLNSYIYNNENYICISYITKMNISTDTISSISFYSTPSAVINDIGTYPMLSGNYINYISQAITKTPTEVLQSLPYNTRNVSYVTNPTTNINLKYDVPMLAKYKVIYDVDGKIKLKLDDSTALNQFVKNTKKNSGTMGVHGSLSDKLFVKSPFVVDNFIYDTVVNGYKLNGLSILKQNYRLDSIVDSNNNRMVCVYFASHIGSIPETITYDDNTHGKVIQGGVIALTIHNLTTTFDKMNPETHIIYENVYSVSDMKLTKHNSDYYLAISYNMAKDTIFNSYVYKITYVDSITPIEVTLITTISNCRKISIQGIADGVME